MFLKLSFNCDRYGFIVSLDITLGVLQAGKLHKSTVGLKIVLTPRGI